MGKKKKRHSKGHRLSPISKDGSIKVPTAVSEAGLALGIWQMWEASGGGKDLNSALSQGMRSFNPLDGIAGKLVVGGAIMKALSNYGVIPKQTGILRW